MIGVTVSGRAALARKLGSLPRAIEAAIAPAIAEAAEEVRGEARATLDSGARSGRVYPRTQGRFHQASAPGEPPKSDSGRLADSLEVEVRGLEARVGTGLARGRDLEFGTRDMAPRPWLFPSLEKARPRVMKLVAEAVREAIRDMAGR